MDRTGRFHLKEGEKHYRVAIFSHDPHKTRTQVYCITALQLIDAANKNIQVIFLVPTQTFADELLALCQELAKKRKLNQLEIRCGRPEAGKLNSKCQMIIGTPTTISTLMKDGIINATKCKLLILDALREMFLPSFDDAVEMIINKIPNFSYIFLYSSSFPLTVEEFLKLPRLCQIAANECSKCIVTKEFAGKVLREKHDLNAELKECKLKIAKLESEASNDVHTMIKLESEVEKSKPTITELKNEARKNKLKITELEDYIRELTDCNEDYQDSLRICLIRIKKLNKIKELSNKSKK